MTQYCNKVLLKPLSMTFKMHRFLNCLLYYLQFFCITWFFFCIIYTYLYYLTCLLYYLYFFRITWIVFCITYTSSFVYLTCLLYYLHFFCITWQAFPGALVPDRSPHSGHSKKMRNLKHISGNIYGTFKGTVSGTFWPFANAVEPWGTWPPPPAAPSPAFSSYPGSASRPANTSNFPLKKICELKGLCH